MAFSLKAVFGLDTTGVKTELKQLRREFNSFVQDYAKLGAGVAVGAFVALSKGALDLAASLKDTAGQIGINVESLQALHYAATQNGSSTEAMNKALEKLRLNTRAAYDGQAQYADALKTIGLTARELIRLPLEQQYARVALAVKNTTDKTAAYNAVSELFGSKIGPDQIQVLESLANDGFPKTAKAAAEAGQIMKAETIVALEAASQAIEDFKKRATIAVGDIIVNFRSEEGLKLLLFQFLKVVGAFGAKIVDAVVDAGGIVKAVIGGELTWVVNQFRDNFLSAVAGVAKLVNKLLPERFRIDVAGLEAMKSAGKDLGDTIVDAIANTKPSTFAKDVTDYWDRAISAQQKVVNQLNNVDLGKPAAALRNAGQRLQESGQATADALDDSAARYVAAGHTVGEAIAAGAVTFSSAQKLWSESIDKMIETGRQLGGLIAGIRGGSVFNQLSDDALAQVVKQNRAKAGELLNPALTKGNFGTDLEAGRLQAEAMNAQRELDLRARFRSAVELKGINGARADFDPVVFENLLRQLGVPDVGNELKRLNNNLEKGVPTVVMGAGGG